MHLTSVSLCLQVVTNDTFHTLAPGVQPLTVYTGAPLQLPGCSTGSTLLHCLQGSCCVCWCDLASPLCACCSSSATPGKRSTEPMTCKLQLLQP